MSRILVASQSDVRSDPRPNRVIRALRDDHEVTVFGFDGAPTGVKFIPYRKTDHWFWPPYQSPVVNLLLRRYERYLRVHMHPDVEREIQAAAPDVIIAHDLQVMPLLKRNHPGVPIILDLREFYPDQAGNSWRWRLLWRPLSRYLTRTYITKADRLWTVSPGLSQGYEEMFNVDCDVVPSYPVRHDLRPRLTGNGPIRIIHHGNASRTRKLELMIDMAEHLGAGYRLDLMLVEHEADYYAELTRRASKVSNVRIIPAVPFEQIIPMIAQYDIGCFLVPPGNFNLKHCLPNKFFEFIQARLAVAIGPSPDMAEIVRRHDLGVVSDDFTAASLADAIRGLTADDIDRFKQASDVAAQEMNHETLESMIRRDVEALL